MECSGTLGKSCNKDLHCDGSVQTTCGNYKLMAYIHLYVIQKLTFQKNFIRFQLNGMKQVLNGLSMVINIGKDLMEIDQVSSVMVLKLQQMRRI